VWPGYVKSVRPEKYACRSLTTFEGMGVIGRRYRNQGISEEKGEHKNADWKMRYS